MSPTAVGSPQWWLTKLSGELAVRQHHMQMLDGYYTGDHPLPFLTRAHQAKIKNEFRTLLEDSRSNFMALVVDAVEERMRVEGFRLSASTDEAADKESWRIWQANQMDSESQIAFVEALIKGVAYLSVWSAQDGDEFARIAVEDPLQTIVGYEPGSNYRRRAAALKVWKDDWTGKDRANVYLPDGIHKFEAASTSTSTTATVSTDETTFGAPKSPVARAGDTPGRAWKELEDEFVRNPLGVVPIIPLRNRPRLLVEGESELSGVYRVQNQINGFLFLLAIAGYFGAHRQRWATGISLMEGDDGKPVEPFDTAVDRLWVNENPDSKFGDFEQTSLDGYVNAIEQKILHIAVTTRTPRHYLIEQGQSPSGDAIKSAESGLVKKVERKQRPFGEGLEEAIRLARMFQGEEDAPVDSEIVWGDAEIRTEAEITDAAVKRWQARLTPWQQTMEDIGYSQTQIARMLEQFGGTPPQPEPEPVPPSEPVTL